MLPQFDGSAAFSYDKAKSGIQKMLWGYFLKLAIAGRLAIAVENVYADTGAFSGTAVAFAALAYIFMLYCDFEGYSQIAIGSGYLLGITMKENFRQPFFSESMSEIWRRWHVSLSTWFRDYLYIPLGGSRKGLARKYINLIFVLFVSGIWHGANLTFFAWGAINGVFIVAGQMLLPKRDAIAAKIKESTCKTEKSQALFDRIRTALKRIGVYILFAYVFIYFASPDIKSAYLAVKAILTRFTLTGLYAEAISLGLGRFNLLLTLLMAVFVFVADKRAYDKGCDVPSLAKTIPTPLRWAIYYALLIAILFSANLTGKEFIYSKM
jgi:D-alanyl-lipoteichoic acid acyltransferase DltB (MBOAT superfamily)